MANYDRGWENIESSIKQPLFTATELTSILNVNYYYIRKYLITLHQTGRLHRIGKKYNLGEIVALHVNQKHVTYHDVLDGVLTINETKHYISENYRTVSNKTIERKISSKEIAAIILPGNQRNTYRVLKSLLILDIQNKKIKYKKKPIVEYR